MFDFGKSIINMNPDEQKTMLANLAPGHRKGAYEMGIGFDKPHQKQQQRQQKRDAYHDLDRLNHIVETENDAHDFFTKGLNDWQKGVTGKKPSKAATGLKKQFDDYEQATLSQFNAGGKRHTALSESLPKIKDTFLKQGHQFALDKINERSRTVLDKGLQRIANGALGAKTRDRIKAHDDAAFDLINKYVLSEAKFDAKDADAMYERYLGYAGVESQSIEPGDATDSATPGGQTMEYDYERDGGDHRRNMFLGKDSEVKKEMFAATDSETQADAGDEEREEKDTDKSSAQHAREMEEKAEKGNESGKLAGADNDSHRKKSAGTDKDITQKNWTPEEAVETAWKYIGNTDWSVDAEKDNFPAGTNKCNKFIHDVLEESGAKVPLINDDRDPFTDEKYPPVAKDWEDKDKTIDGWVVVKTPKNGDVASYDGHVGIVSGEDTTVSASSEAGKVVENDWGFRSHQKGKVTFRRYVGRKGRP